jgi:hypothetical protein
MSEIYPVFRFGQDKKDLYLSLGFADDIAGGSRAV